MKTWISCVAILASSLSVASAAVVLEPHRPVHIHYVIVTDSTGQRGVRPANACDVAKLLSDDLKRMKSSDRDLAMHVNMLHGLACRT